MASAPPNLLTVHSKCNDCPIRHRAVCSYSDPIELAELERAKFYRDYQPGQEIVGEGEVAAFLGSVVDGVVALHKSMPDGRRQTVGLLFASDFIGRPMRSVAPYDAIAVTPVRMCLFHRSEFEQIMKRRVTLEHRLLEMILDELDAARDWMLLLGRKSAKEKLASFLMILARRAAAAKGHRQGVDISFTLPLTREAIAEYLGLTIETVSRQMTDLRKKNIIHVEDHRRVSILDIIALAEITQDDVPDDLIPVDNTKNRRA